MIWFERVYDETTINTTTEGHYTVYVEVTEVFPRSLWDRKRSPIIPMTSLLMLTPIKSSWTLNYCVPDDYLLCPTSLHAVWNTVKELRCFLRSPESTRTLWTLTYCLPDDYWLYPTSLHAVWNTLKELRCLMRSPESTRTSWTLTYCVPDDYWLYSTSLHAVWNTLWKNWDVFWGHLNPLDLHELWPIVSLMITDCTLHRSMLYETHCGRTEMSYEVTWIH